MKPITRRIPDEAYRAILENMPVCCVDIVIQHENKALMVLRKNKPAQGLWWLPGGRIYKYESLEEAAKRKAYEETGLQVKIKKKIGVYETMFDDGPLPGLESGVHTINIAFLAEPLDKNPSVKGVKADYLDYRWVSAIDEALHWYPAQVLKDAGIFAKKQVR